MQKGLLRPNRLFLYIFLLLGVFLVWSLARAGPIHAAAGINQTINFQGRLLNSQGATVPDGYYNIQFKIYQDGAGDTVGNPGGTLKWTENYLNNNTQGVRVVNGFLSVNLGSVTAFGSSVDWNQDTLWLSMNIGGTNGSCTPFSSCSPDGEMVPMQRLTAAPYALNSGLLGGLSSSSFVQLAQGVQTDSSTSNPSIYINKTGGTANIIQLQKSGADVLTVGNGGLISLQPAASLTGTGTQTHITQSLTTNQTGGTVTGYDQTITVSNASGTTTTNGVKITINDNASSLANTEVGLKVTLAGSNTSSNLNKIAIDASTDRGIGLRALSAGTGNVTCDGYGSNGVGYGICAGYSGTSAATGATGIYGYNYTGGATLNINTAGDDWFGTAITGVNSSSTTSTTNIVGVKGGVKAQGASGSYTAIGVLGVSKAASSSATTYGGYFTLDPTSSTNSGAALYASNSSISGNIVQFQDNTTNVFLINNDGNITMSPQSSNDVTISGDSDSQLILSGITNDITTGTNEALTLTPNGTGDTVVSIDGDSNLQVTATAAPGVDMLSLSNSGQSSTTDGVDGTVITFGVSNASGDAVHITPSFMADGTDTYNIIEVDALAMGASSGSNTVNGLKIGNLTENGTVTSTGFNLGTGWDTGITIGSATTGVSVSATTDITTGTNEDLTVTANGTGDVVILGDSDTQLILSGITTDITTATDEALTIVPNGTGDTIFTLDADTNIQISSSAAPGADMVSISNSGQSSTTAGVDGISLTFGSTNASGDALHITPSFTTNTTATYNGIELDAFTATRSAGTATVYGINIGDLTESGTVTSTGVRIGSGYDVGLEVASASGTGTIKFTGNSGPGAVAALVSNPDGNERSRMQFNIRAGGAGYITFNTGAIGSVTERLQITENGDVGIGNTSPGTNRLVVSNQSTTDNILLLQDNASTVLLVGDGGSLSVTPSDDSAGITFGSTSQAGTITLGQSTATNTISIGAAAGNGNTQTINIGTSSTSGSTTNLSIGSTIAGTLTLRGLSGITIDGNTSLSGSNTFTTGTGAVALNGNTTVASGKTFTSNGSALFKINSDSTTAFQVQNSNSRTLMVGDTTNNIVTVGNSTDGANLTLGATGNASGAIRKSMVVNGSISSNDLVEIDTSNAGQVKQAVSSSTKIFGVATSGIGSGSSQDIVISGVYEVNANSNGGTIAVGDTLVSSSTAGQATKASSTISSGTVVGLALSTLSGGKVWVYINLGLGGSDNLQTVYNKDTGSTTPDIKVSSGVGGIDIQDADGTIGASLFTVRASNGSGLGSSILDVQSTGAVSITPTTASSTVVVGSTSQTGTLTVGQSTASNTISIGAAAGNGNTQTINIGTSGTSGSTTDVTIGSTVAGTTTIRGLTAISLNGNTSLTGSNTFTTGTGAVALNGDTTVASGKTFTANGSALFRINSNSATAFQVQNSSSRNLLLVDTSGSNVTVGNSTDGGTLNVGSAAGSGLLKNNGATVNSTLALSNLDYSGSGNSGPIGSAATTVDIYTAISISQTTSGQTLTIPTPTASTTYGRTIYMSNVGSQSFIVGGIRIPPGATATLVWSNTNGGASWQFAGAGGTSIENQNGSDQSADFRISGTGRANTSFVSPLFDSITGTLSVGTSTATGVTIGGTTNTTSIVLQAAASATYTLGTSNNTGGITLGNSTATNTISLGSAAGNGNTQTINIGTSSTSGSTTRVNIGSSQGGYTQVNGSLGVGTSTTPAEKLDVNGAIRIGTTSSTNAGTIRWTGTDFEGYNGATWKSMTTQYLSVNPVVNTRKLTDECVNSNGAGGCASTANTLQDDNELFFAIGANETWTFRFLIFVNGNRTPDFKASVTSPAGSACTFGYVDAENASSVGNVSCATGASVTTAADSVTDVYDIVGTVVNSTTAGNVRLQWAQNSSSTSSVTVQAGSFLQANRNLSTGDATLQAFVDNGNSFGVAADLGTNDAYDLNLQTNGQLLATFSSSNGSALFKNWSNSTSAFRVQTSGGSTLLGVDTTNSQVLIGQTSTATGKLAFANSGVANTVTMSAGSTSSSYTIELPTSAGSANQCLQYGGSGGTQLQWGACGTNSTGLAKDAADSSSASVSASSQLYTFTNSASATAGGVLKLDNGTNTNSALVVTASGNPTSGQAIIFASNTNASPSGNLLDLQSGASPTSKFSVSSAGALTTGSVSFTATGTQSIDTGAAAAINIGPTNATSIVLGGNTSATITEKVANSSTTAYRLQTAGGTNYLVADTTNGRLIVGTGSTGQTSGEILVLDNDTNATYRAGSASNAPTVVNGAMFYSSSDHAFICGVDSSWQTCSGMLGSNTAASTAVNTCTTVCPSFDNGRFVIPANYLQPGRVIHLFAQGTYGTTGTPTFGAWGVYFGSDATTKSNDTLLGGATATSAALPNNASAQHWMVDYTITCYTAGASGTVSAKGTFTFVQSATSTTTETVLPLNSSTTTTMDTTAAQTIYLFPAWGTSNSSNTATAQQIFLKAE